MNNTAAIVASYRTPTATISSSLPCSLRHGSQECYLKQVQVGWVDNASNETGFKMDRSRTA